jgi:hypothetical protein
MTKTVHSGKRGSDSVAFDSWYMIVIMNNKSQKPDANEFRKDVSAASSAASNNHAEMKQGGMNGQIRMPLRICV